MKPNLKSFHIYVVARTSFKIMKEHKNTVKYVQIEFEHVPS